MAAKPNSTKSVALPRSENDVARFIDEVDKHPDSTEVSYRLAGMLAEVKARGGESVTQWSRLRYAWDRKTHQKRRHQHESICHSLLTETARASKGQKPVATVVLGPPGAGKTTIAVPWLKGRLGLDFVSVNPDDVKERLPDYEGWNAAALHEESSDVAERRVQAEARAGRFNVLYDVTGRSPDKIKVTIEEYAGYGYDVFLVLVDLPAWQAAGRVWERFQANPFCRNGRKSPGRYVPPSYVCQQVADYPKKAFDDCKGHSKTRAYCRIDAASPLEDGPIVVEEKGW